MTRRARWVVAAAVLAALGGCAGSGAHLARRGPAVRGPPGDPWGPYIHEASVSYRVPEAWIRQVMRQESGGRQYMNGRQITSSAGAAGLMQVLPSTYRQLAARYGLGSDPYDPHDNIMAGSAYLREMYEKYGSPGFLAAYNAGPGRVDQYLAGGASLPAETVNYVASIAPRLGGEVAMSGPLAVYGGGGGEAASYAAAPAVAPASVRVASAMGRRSLIGSGPVVDPESFVPSYVAPLPPEEAPTGPSPSEAGLTGPVPGSIPAPIPAPEPVMVASSAGTPISRSALGLSTRTPVAGTGGETMDFTVAQGGPVAVAPSPLVGSAQPVRPPSVLASLPASPASPVLPASPILPTSRVSSPSPATAVGPRFRLVPVRPDGRLLPLPPTPAEARALSVAPPPPVLATVAGGSGGWAVQVGAYPTPMQARAAAEAARTLATNSLPPTAVVELGAARKSGGGALFRARLAHLSPAAAEATCKTLRAHGTACTAVPPGAA